MSLSIKPFCLIMFTNVVRAFLCKTTSKGKIQEAKEIEFAVLSGRLNITFETFQDRQYLSFWAIKPLNRKATSEQQKLTKYAHSVMLSTPPPPWNQVPMRISCFPA